MQSLSLQHYQQNNAVVQFANHTSVNATLGADGTQTLAISVGTSMAGYPDHQANFITNAAAGMRTEIFSRVDFTKYTSRPVPPLPTPSPDFVPGLPHAVLTIELTQALSSYRDYHMLLLPLARTLWRFYDPAETYTHMGETVFTLLDVSPKDGALSAAEMSKLALSSQAAHLLKDRRVDWTTSEGDVCSSFYKAIAFPANGAAMTQRAFVSAFNSAKLDAKTQHRSKRTRRNQVVRTFNFEGTGDWAGVRLYREPDVRTGVRPEFPGGAVLRIRYALQGDHMQLVIEDANRYLWAYNVTSTGGVLRVLTPGATDFTYRADWNPDPACSLQGCASSAGCATCSGCKGSTCSDKARAQPYASPNISKVRRYEFVPFKKGHASVLHLAHAGEDPGSIAADAYTFKCQARAPISRLGPCAAHS